MPTASPATEDLSATVPKHAGSRTTLVLGAGFALVLSMLIAVVAIGVNQLVAANQRLETVVNQLNAKQELSEKLFRYARERVVVLQRMFVIEDPFERDELSLRLDHFAAKFIKTRQRLVELGLTSEEKGLMARQYALASHAVEVQRRVSVLIIDGQLEEARQLMTEEMFPAQERVLEILEQLAILQRTAAEEALSETLAQQVKARLTMYALGLGAALFGALIAAFSVRRTRRAEQALAYEKERAQVSLHSLADGVITTTSDGRIDYINPIGQRLTGWSHKDAIGKPLLDVLRLIEERQRRGVAQNLSELLAANHKTSDLTDRCLLQRRDGQELHVEHSVARIGIGESGFGGVVVVFRDVSEMVQLARQLTHQVRHDPLTGLFSRREFERLLEHAQDGARQFGQQHMLLFLDLDRFKVVNDSCGHAAGDELLRQLSSLLRTSVRDSDRVARLGGDEFGILLEGCPQPRALAIAETIRHEVEQFVFHWEGQRFTIGVSIGMTQIDADSGELSELLARADSACYQAKNAGRNRVHLFSDTDGTPSVAGTSFIQLVRAALAGDGFQLNCQRIRPLHQGHTHPPMCEVLLRLTDPNGRELLPMAFMPTAERYNLMAEVDLWVVGHLLGQMQQANETPSRLFAINLSEQSLTCRDFLPRLLELLQANPSAASLLCFEIAESSALTHYSQLTELTEQLRTFGVRIAFDDFGQGFNTFGYLSRLQIDYIKLDATLTRSLQNDPLARETVRAIVSMARLLEIRTVAKYVEDAETEQLLDTLGVDYVQGYHIDRPQPLGGKSITLVEHKVDAHS